MGILLNNVNFMTYHLTEEQKEVLFGILLGDASMHYRNIRKKSIRLEIKQGIKNKEYLIHLYGIFQNLMDNKNKISISKHAVYFKTRTLESLFNYYGIFYIDKKKCITDAFLKSAIFTSKSLAYWFMDDGHCENIAGRYKISTQCFSYEDQLKLQKFLAKRFKLDTTLYKKDGSYIIVIKRTSTHLFKKLISPFIIPSMKYKLGSFERDINGKLIDRQQSNIIA